LYEWMEAEAGEESAESAIAATATRSGAASFIVLVVFFVLRGFCLSRGRVALTDARP
jgi:hypothetical protein